MDYLPVGTILTPRHDAYEKDWAGTGIPSIRIFGEERTTTLLRINLHESLVDRSQDFGVAATALKGIEALVEICR